MNIIYLAHRVPFPANKGEKIRTYHQIKFLIDMGHDLYVFAPIEADFEVGFADALQLKLGVKVFTQKLGSPFLRKALALITRQPVSQTHFFSRKLLNEFERLIQKAPPDAVICTSSAMAVYIEKSGLADSRNRGCRLLMDFMDLDSDKWQQYADHASWPMRWVYQREAKLVSRAEQKIYQQFDHCFFISDNEVQLFARQVADASKVSALANGLDTTTFYPATSPPEPTPPVFLFVGVMNYKPNEDAVLWFVESMWPKVRKLHPAARFVIAGMSPSSRIQQLAEQQGIQVTGYVDDILPYFQQASIFIAPFRLARGVQNKILQAMACGLPVITTPLGAEGIDCEPGVHLLTAETEADFIDRIGQVLLDSELRSTLQSKGPELIREQYSWEGVLQMLPHWLQCRSETEAEHERA